jgi:hypothetical protein
MASQISAKVLRRKEFTTTAIVDHLRMANSSISGWFNTPVEMLCLLSDRFQVDASSNSEEEENKWKLFSH